MVVPTDPEKGRALTIQEQEDIFTRYLAENEGYNQICIAIEDDTTDAIWADFFADTRAERKKREEWFEDLKKPLNAALAVVRAKEHQACDRLKEVEDLITSARAAWMTKKIAETTRLNKESMQEAETSGGGVAIVMPKPQQTVHTASGASVGLAKQASWRFTDDPQMTAKRIDREGLEFNRDEPLLAHVPNKAFYLKKGLIMPLLKTGEMPEGEHSIERFDDFRSTSK